MEKITECWPEGSRAVACTDHGVMAGVWDCASQAKKYGVNFIPGCEFYLIPDIDKCRGKEWGRGASSHIVLLAADQEGWENLLLLTAYSNIRGYYHQPRIDFNALRQFSEGLFCLSGCLGSYLGKAFFRDDSVRLAAEVLWEIFGDRFSLEIQLNSIEEQYQYNDALIQVHKDTGIPLVATGDSHYLDKSDSHKQDLLFALQLDKVLDDPNRHRLPERMHSVETPDEMVVRFIDKYGQYGQQAIAHTIEIADNCKEFNLMTESKDLRIPKFDVYKSEDYVDFQKWQGEKCSCHSVSGECLVHKETNNEVS